MRRTPKSRCAPARQRRATRSGMFAAPRRAARCPGTPAARYAVWYVPSTRRAIARATSRSFSAQPPRTQRSMTPPRPRATYTSAASAPAVMLDHVAEIADEQVVERRHQLAAHAPRRDVAAQHRAAAGNAQRLLEERRRRRLGRPREPLEAAQHHVVEQRLLVAVVVVERRTAHVGACADLADGDLLERLLGRQLLERPPKRRPALLDAPVHEALPSFRPPSATRANAKRSALRYDRSRFSRSQPTRPIYIILQLYSILQMLLARIKPTDTSRQPQNPSRYAVASSSSLARRFMAFS